MFPSADIVRALEEDIVFGSCHPKERLTEDGLMARFKLKRHLVRDALRQLDAMGLVVRVPNRGAFVRELTPKEAIEIYEIREILEVAAALRTPLPAPKEVTEALREIQDKHSAAITKNDLRNVFWLNRYRYFLRANLVNVRSAKLASTTISPTTRMYHWG